VRRDEDLTRKEGKEGGKESGGRDRIFASSFGWVFCGFFFELPIAAPTVKVEGAGRGRDGIAKPAPKAWGKCPDGLRGPGVPGLRRFSSASGGAHSY